MKKIVLLFIAVALTGCATIVGDHSQALYLASNEYEEGTKVLIESKGQTYTAILPATVVLPNTCNGADIYLAKNRTPIRHVTSEMNTWVLGNILFGGVIGLTIDGLSGNMCHIGEKSVSL